MKFKVLLIAACAQLLVACDKKAEGQTVAVVNGQEITLTELNHEMGLINIPAGFDKAAARSQVLQSMINRRLLTAQSRAEGVDTSPDFINRQRRGEEDLLISMLSARRLNAIPLPNQRETDAFINSRPGMFAQRQIWGLEQIQYPQQTSPRILAEIEQAQGFAQLVTILQKNGVNGQIQKNRLDTAQVPADLFQKIIGLPPGRPFIVPIGDRVIASVITSREPQPLLGDAARPAAAAALRNEKNAKSMTDRIKDLRSNAKIEYKSGFAPAKT